MSPAARFFTELERAGDEAKKIAKITRRLIVGGGDPNASCRESFVRISAAARDALEQVVEAVRTRDEQLAIRVADADQQLDLEYKRHCVPFRKAWRPTLPTFRWSPRPCWS